MAAHGKLGSAPPRQWLRGRRRDKEAPLLRVVTYNVLGDGEHYALSGAHSYCDRRFLQWDYRGNLITAELLAYDADVICLQEVTPAMYETTIGPFFRRLGYRGEYLGRFLPHWTYGHDECLGQATFWRESRFTRSYRVSTMLCTEEFDRRYEKFGGAAVLDSSPEAQEATQCLRTRADGALFVALRDNHTNQSVVVANTHLYWDTARNVGKTVQDLQMVLVAHSLRDFLDGLPRDEVALVMVCGDLNSEPDSAVITLMREGSVSVTNALHPGALGVMPLAALQSCLPRFRTTHEVVTGHRAPKATTRTNVYCDAIDYILVAAYDPARAFTYDGRGGDDALVELEVPVHAVLSMPFDDTHEALSRLPWAPNENWPSDHFAVGAAIEPRISRVA